MAQGKVDKALQQLFKQSVKIVKLWENASPSSAFAAQTVTVNGSGYDSIAILYRLNAGSSKTGISIGNDIRLEGIYNVLLAGTVTFAMRNVEYVNNKIVLDNARVKTGTDGAVVQNQGANIYCVPFKIYGVKLLGGGYSLIEKIRHFLCERRCLA